MKTRRLRDWLEAYLRAHNGKTFGVDFLAQRFARSPKQIRYCLRFAPNLREVEGTVILKSNLNYADDIEDTESITF